ncbi:zinc finger cdgsh type protein [Besnoitia besnoiti]|uniref:Zinc finger cdgsh type protein n=1 Tax=Besnoitia besnoiti TaxID=94643 RepID=A0A2A9M5S9_BESBE|nr:zinc finger cdgsh type protein [Besnoitia besnoiti]PFH33299.1 zinc finger cdgsh type protein [Besnoitia besnoiti]
MAPKPTQAPAAVSDDPLAYMDQLDFNTRKFPQYSHIIENSPQPGQPERVVAVCRCWQSKKFPYCDGAHKVMMEAGDNVGPFLAKLRDSREGTQKLRNVSTLHQQTTLSSPFVALREVLSGRSSVRGRPVVAAALLSAAAGYAVAEGALRRGWRLPTFALAGAEKETQATPAPAVGLAPGLVAEPQRL